MANCTEQPPSFQLGGRVDLREHMHKGTMNATLLNEIKVVAARPTETHLVGSGIANNVEAEEDGT